MVSQTPCKVKVLSFKSRPIFGAALVHIDLSAHVVLRLAL